MARPDRRDGVTGAAGADPVLLQRGNLVVTRSRAIRVGALLLLLLLGVVLPYVTLGYIDARSVPVTGRPRLFGAAGLLGGVDPTYLPGYRQEIRSAYNLALNFAAAGPGLQQIGTVVAVLSCWALLTEEINRIVWWFLHLSAYPLLLAAVPLLIGAHQLHALGVPLGVGPAWVPGLLAGVLVWLSSWQARSRIDTYGSF
ncbi:hypothetical protein [Microlunatus antarcticus]|uniref:Uncharacterized protein n=1 Tax=Microlunatus antarcticus TaxID=53388 RepID=A0A7W5JUW2_9ACTN|nr:hypothetical protein [Microlunatus antarcticus]MBB3326775.1 hypothetical protein [Microlunatus antarcticus]